MTRVFRASPLVSSALVILAFVAADVAHAQHIHDQHPTSLHNGTWRRWMMIDNWSSNETVTLDNQTTETLHWERFTNCTCEVVNIEISEESKRTHKVTVSGSYTQGSSAEATAKALAGSVKATAHASVTISGGSEWTNEVTYKITQSTTNPKCNIKDYKETIERYDASGSVDHAEHKIICKCTCGAVATNYCNKQTITSDGVGFDGRNHTWITIGPCEPCPCPKDEEDKPSDTGGGNTETGHDEQPDDGGGSNQ